MCEADHIDPAGMYLCSCPSIRSFGAIVMGQVNPIGRTAAAKGRFSGAPPHPRGFLGEPTLSDLLRDPIAEALMAADHVELRDLNILLATARCHLHSPGTHPAILYQPRAAQAPSR
jgi:hypothetical protein